MVVADIQDILDRWAPPSIAWERDNVGLQIGSRRSRVRRILLCLDVTPDVVAAARRSGSELVVSHHPLLFRPAGSIDTGTTQGAMIAEALGAGISVVSLHTNLDFIPSGVNYALGMALGLTDLEVLEPLEKMYQKIAVFVPQSHAETVMLAMARDGAGEIGAYSECSFSAQGIGTFTPAKAARPFIGAAGKRERVEEVKVEMIVPRWKSAQVIASMRAAHPYEEVAFDLYDLAVPARDVGAGAIGTLPRAESLAAFLRRVKNSLGCRALRYAPGRKPIRRVAVCGGSGSDYLPNALRAGADAYVTADLRYHTFQECGRRIALIDAGHYETEAPVLPHIARRLRSDPGVRRAGIAISIHRRPTNFISYT